MRTGEKKGTNKAKEEGIRIFYRVRKKKPQGSISIRGGGEHQESQIELLLWRNKWIRRRRRRHPPYNKRAGNYDGRVWLPFWHEKTNILLSQGSRDKTDSNQDSGIVDSVFSPPDKHGPINLPPFLKRKSFPLIQVKTGYTRRGKKHFIFWKESAVFKFGVGSRPGFCTAGHTHMRTAHLRKLGRSNNGHVLLSTQRKKPEIQSHVHHLTSKANKQQGGICLIHEVSL